MLEAVNFSDIVLSWYGIFYPRLILSETQGSIQNREGTVMF